MAQEAMKRCDTMTANCVLSWSELQSNLSNTPFQGFSDWMCSSSASFSSSPEAPSRNKKRFFKYAKEGSVSMEGLQKACKDYLTTPLTKESRPTSTAMRLNAGWDSSWKPSDTQSDTEAFEEAFVTSPR